MEYKTIELGKLRDHPSNPNRMSRDKFRKLLSHTKRTGVYEPLIVRVHPNLEGCYEIINGHHRRKALQELGQYQAHCVVWDVSDEEVDILLCTLNRLGGCDDLQKTAAIVERLGRHYPVKEMSKMLPQTRAQIEKLISLRTAKCELKMPSGNTDMPSAEVFFLTKEQKQAVENAIAAVGAANAKERAASLVKICQAYLGDSKLQKSA